jgi:hypothetical protein
MFNSLFRQLGITFALMAGVVCLAGQAKAATVSLIFDGPTASVGLTGTFHVSGDFTISSTGSDGDGFKLGAFFALRPDDGANFTVILTGEILTGSVMIGSTDYETTSLKFLFARNVGALGPNIAGSLDFYSDTVNPSEFWGQTVSFDISGTFTVGLGTNPSTTSIFNLEGNYGDNTVTVVPEPSVAGLALGAGFALVGYRRRSR